MNKKVISRKRNSLSILCAYFLALNLLILPVASVSAQASKSFVPNIIPKSLTQPAGDNFAPQVVFSNPAAITLTDATGPIPTMPANPYPSNITVSGLTGTLSAITVTFNALTMPRPRGNDFMLVAPTGQAMIIMGDVGGITASNNITVTIDDAAAAQFPTTNVTIPSGTYRPTSVAFVPGESDTFPAPAPAVFTRPAPESTATLTSTFGGINPNGTWSLYAVDDEAGGGNGTMAGGWSIDITTFASAATTTTVTSNINPSLTTQAVTFTAQVTSSSTVNIGTVDFFDGATLLASNVPVNASGQAQFTAPANTLNERTHNIIATYDGNATFGTSTGSMNQVVSSPTVQTGASFCNNGSGLSITDNGTAAAYPSNITVAGLIGTITRVTTSLNNMTLPRPRDIDVLMVGPTNQNLVLMADVGDLTAASGINFIVDSTAASQMPTGSGSTLSSGTFRPTDFLFGAGDDVFPAPAPAVINQPAPTGSATLALFNGTNPNGIWRLYAYDDGAGGGASSIGSWCVNFQLAPLTSTTTIQSSMNPQIPGANVTFTATVTIPGQTPTGNVQFFDGATPIGPPVALNGSGQAQFTTNSLTEGLHNITAQYLGTSTTGGGGFAASTSAILVQRIYDPTAASVTVGGRIMDTGGRSVGFAQVTLVAPNGMVQHALTNPFGYYRFTDVSAGETYTVIVQRKGYVFDARVIAVSESIDNFDFTAQPEE